MLSKEDQERKQIDFAASEIFDRLIGPQRDGIQTFIYNKIFVLVDHYKTASKIEGFNEGIKAARKILCEYRLKPYHSISEIDERVEKLKKTV